jgi:hypothetical protein
VAGLFFFIIVHIRGVINVVFIFFSLMLAAAAHAITCTEGYFLFGKDKGSFYLNKDDAIIDKYFVDYIDSDDFSSYKFIREQDRVVTEREESDQGVSSSDTSIIYLINGIDSPAVDNSIAYTKSNSRRYNVYRSHFQRTWR